MKNNRLEKILEIIENNVIATQDDLQNALNDIGFKVTQSTVSRDIKKLRLIKGHDAQGNYRYINAAVHDDGRQLSDFEDIIIRSVRSVDCAMNDVVIKCSTGMASSACVAIDAIFSNKMLGSIAGDDTIFVITRNSSDAVELKTHLENIL